MSRYQHTKGQIKDNALEALLHDPLFRQRVEKNKKGKGSYQRKGKHAGQNGREASGKLVDDFFTFGLLLLRLLKTDGCGLSAGHEFRQAGLLLWLAPVLLPGPLPFSCSVYSSV